jgi:hypothetical protein
MAGPIRLSIRRYWLLDQRIKDPGDRQKLIELMDNLPAVEAWRDKQSPEDRRRWTHPTTIHRHWKASLRPPGDYKGKPTAAQREVLEETLTDKVDALRKENAQMKIEAGKRCDVDLLHSDRATKEKWFRARIMPEHEARWLRDILLELYPLPLPKVQPTTDDPAEDDIG